MEAELSVLKEGESDLVRIHMVNNYCDLLLYDEKYTVQSNEELRRRLAAVDCQMRKEKKAVRRYEVATEKLLQFVEVTKLNNIILNLNLIYVPYFWHRTAMKHSSRLQKQTESCKLGYSQLYTY